jgi:hypothetical protein
MFTIESKENWLREIEAMKKAQQTPLYYIEDGEIIETNLYDWVTNQAPETTSPRGVESIDGIEEKSLFLLYKNGNPIDYFYDIDEAKEAKQEAWAGEEDAEFEIISQELYKCFTWIGQRQTNEVWFDDQQAAEAYRWKCAIQEYHDHSGGRYDYGYDSLEEAQDWVLQNTTIHRLMNHDSSHEKPRFEAFSLKELNEQFETNYQSIEEAVDADPEYLFTEEQMEDYTNESA